MRGKRTSVVLPRCINFQKDKDEAKDKIKLKPNKINARKEDRRGFAKMHQFSKR